MVNLQQLAARLHDQGVINKSFMDCSKSEIEGICEAVLSSIGEDVPPGGWEVPRIVDGYLINPLNGHPKYHWWKPSGQELRLTLLELDAPYEVAKNYIAGLTPEAWANELIPF